MSHLPKNPNLEFSFDEKNLRDIYLAGGCYWGTEAYMARVPGIAETSVGFANGHVEHPTYQEVYTDETGHAETVHVRYDVTKISLQTVLEEFFGIIVPTSLNKQGGDIGTRYRTGVYTIAEADQVIVKKFIEQVQLDYDKPIVTEVEPLLCYFLAEESHQNYLEKNPDGYCHVSFDGLNK